jgi:hypothetical protein
MITAIVIFLVILAGMWFIGNPFGWLVTYKLDPKIKDAPFNKYVFGGPIVYSNWYYDVHLPNRKKSIDLAK